MMQNLSIIGRAEKVSFPDFGVRGVYAKIDTGADMSSIWASNIHEQDGYLRFKLFGEGSDHYTGHEVSIPQADFLLTRVASSFGHREYRYVVKLRIKVKGKVILATFSLSDRSTKTYPILLGRKLLNGKFLVDVSKGSTLKWIEDEKKRKMKKDLETFTEWENT